MKTDENMNLIVLGIWVIILCTAACVAPITYTVTKDKIYENAEAYNAGKYVLVNNEKTWKWNNDLKD